MTTTAITPQVRYGQLPSGDRYSYEIWGDLTTGKTPLLLIHPVGVGLWRRFWQRFCLAWCAQSARPLIVPDLLGCGDSDMAQHPYSPQDWAEQLAHLLRVEIQQPAIAVAQGALMPAAVALVETDPDWVQGLVFSGPPAWRVIERKQTAKQQRRLWRLFCSPLGWLFFQYARSPFFLRRFSRRQLFAQAEQIDREWMQLLAEGSRKQASRHAVYAFLSRNWQQGWGDRLAKIPQPTLLLFGEGASSISRDGRTEDARDRLQAYAEVMPCNQGQILKGRNVLPYESTADFIAALNDFCGNYFTAQQFNDAVQ
ncbi:alpha/beta hydrolase [Synechococcus elongatus IITB4]|uniref:alpha/beta fold hydrolase n=1 Tax=Synechococcus elongatus TaxID=32046 RepID=UPI0030CC6960